MYIQHGHGSRWLFQPSLEPVLPETGYVASKGITYKGLDDRGYPVIDIPESMVVEPNRDQDGTPVLPQSWKD